MTEDPPARPRPSASRWLVGGAGALALVALGLSTALLATARRNATVSSLDEQSAIAAGLARELKADWAGHELPPITAKAHAWGIDLVCPPDPAGGAASSRGAGLDLDDVIEAGQLAQNVVRLLHERLPTYPWRCQIRHGDRCVVRARYDTIRHMVVLDEPEPE